MAIRSVTDNSFQKRAIVCPKLYPNRVLIRYLGDEKSAKKLAHGNSKNPNKNFTRTKDSEMQKLKMEKDKYPVKVYSEKLVEALVKNVTDERQNVDVVRDLKQVKNTMHRERKHVWMMMKFIILLNSRKKRILSLMISALHHSQYSHLLQ